MKYFKKLEVYKNSSGKNWLSLKEMSGYSYDWWQYLKVMKGKVVFNNYTYSNSTAKHLNDAMRVLRDNNIKIDVEIAAPRGLQQDGLESAIEYQLDKLNTAKERLANKLTRQKTRPMLEQQIEDAKTQIRLINELTDNVKAKFFNEIGLYERQGVK
jgi:hypothetical protein